MAVFRVNKSKDYTVMSNYHLQDKNLSLKAKGLLSLMLSLPEGWDYSVRGLEKICLERKNAINRILNELEENKYLIRKRIYFNGKISDWEYNIYETNLCPQNEDLRNEDLQNEDLENGDINKILNNKILKNKNTKEEKVERYFDNEEVNELFNEFLDFRRKLKAVNNDKAITLLVNKLKDYEDETKMKMINQSIENSWKSVFPLKKEYKRKENGFELLERLKREELEKQNAKK